MRSVVVLAWLVAIAACQREAGAQVVERDPLGPVRCFTLTTDRQLSQQSALELCGGQPTDAPGRCYATGLDRAPGLSSQQIQQLCTVATSLAPLECYLRLDADGILTDQQMLDYCGATCPIGPPPPQSASPACLSAAIESTDLALQTAGELCANSSSAGPVRCYLAADALQTLTETQLVQLCAEQYQCQYSYGGPTGGYAPSGGY